jgi:Holliday junction resolvase-like predicted endonuclease
MKRYTKADVSEQQLEDLVRRHPDLIEEGLAYVDHQQSAAGGRLDVLMVDSGKSLVVAELKVTQDDGMMLQELDYYDHVLTHIERYARMYRAHSIDPTQKVRLFLIAPSFSQALVNRIKWLDLPVSLFTFACLKLEDEADIVPIFTELQITAPPEIAEVTQMGDHLGYIIDDIIRAEVVALLEEIKNWKPAGIITIDPIKHSLSIKVNNRLFAYLTTGRKQYRIGTFDAVDDWREFAIKTDDDLATTKPLVKAAMERRLKE